MRVATAELISTFEFALPEVQGKGTSGMEKGESGNYTRAPNAPEIRLLVRRIVVA